MKKKTLLISQINIDSFQEAEDILKAAGEEELFEKAKWNVGDEKVYQGVTYVVGGFNAKGVPLWRKKKDGDSGNVGNAGTGSTTTTKQKPTTQVASKRFVLPNLKQVFQIYKF